MLHTIESMWDDCGHLTHEMHVYVQKGVPLVAFCRYGDKPKGVPGGPANAKQLRDAVAALYRAAGAEGLLRSQQPVVNEEANR